jgi:integrase
MGGKQRTFAIGRFGIVSIADARKKARDIARAVSLGEDPLNTRDDEKSCPTLDEFVDSLYFPFARVHKRSVSTDARYYRHHLQPSFGRMRLNQITKVQITRLLQAKSAEGLAPATVNRVLVLLHFMFNKALEWTVPGLKENPARGVKSLPVNNKRERYLTPEEAGRLRKALEKSPNQTLSYALIFLLLTGARRQEALSARWSDIDLDRRIWRVPQAKSGKSRHIVLSDAALECLGRAREFVASLGSTAQKRSPFVFPSAKTGEPMTTLYKGWHNIRCQAGLRDLRIHDLRHSYASALVNNGVPLYEVQKLLGHASIKTTERYAHLSAGRLVESAAVAGTYYSGILSKT